MNDHHEDELARRRAARRGAGGEQMGMGDEEPVRFSWTDTFAMIIAAYQVLMPILLVMIAVLLLVYFLFRWFFL